MFTTQNGRRLTPDAQGVYWPLTADANGYWNPAKAYGNVVLTWSTQSRTTDSQFTLLNAILSTLGKPASAVTAKLPASELSCESQGITPAGSARGHVPRGRRHPHGRQPESHPAREGHGRPRHQDQARHASSTRRRIRTSRRCTPRARSSPSSWASTNTGSAPINDVDDAELEIGGKYYSQDDDATFDLDSLNTFPMQPGDSGSTVLAFDIPKAAALDAVAEGEIVFPDSPDDEIDFSTKLYAIKLASRPRGWPGHGAGRTHTKTVGRARAGARGRRQLDLSRLDVQGPGRERPPRPDVAAGAGL